MNGQDAGQPKTYAAPDLARSYPLAGPGRDGHPTQVARLALALFDQLADHHGLGPRQRRLLECAARLHDIGWVGGRRKHHKRSMQLIQDDRSLPFKRRDRALIAQIARYHRKALPSLRHQGFAALDPSDRALVRLLAGLLRVADGLDYRHLNNVRSVACRWMPQGLVLHCRGENSAEPECVRAKQKGDLLEKVLRRPLTVVHEVWPAGEREKR